VVESFPYCEPRKFEEMPEGLVAGTEESECCGGGERLRDEL